VGEIDGTSPRSYAPIQNKPYSTLRMVRPHMHLLVVDFDADRTMHNIMLMIKLLALRMTRTSVMGKE
jgi:hypothetical protein